MKERRRVESRKNKEGLGKEWKGNERRKEKYASRKQEEKKRRKEKSQKK